MSAALESRAEVAKIARLLALDPAQLDYLEPAPADALRRLRDQITDALFDGDRARLHGSATFKQDGIGGTSIEDLFFVGALKASTGKAHGLTAASKRVAKQNG